jgi:hypothetical protein
LTVPAHKYIIFLSQIDLISVESPPKPVMIVDLKCVIAIGRLSLPSDRGSAVCLETYRKLDPFGD